MSQNFHTSYAETLGKLETQYCKLKVSFCRFSYILLIESGSPQSALFPNSEISWFGPVLVFCLLGYIIYYALIHMYYNIFPIF